METFRTYCYDRRLRPTARRELHADRVPHAPHCRQRAGHPEEQRSACIKPRVGGGFGAKQTAVSAVYPAFVTWMTEKALQDHLHAVSRAMICVHLRATRCEMHVRLGADEGRHRSAASISIRSPIPALTASTARPRSACPATSPSRSTASAEAFRFAYDVVYTNIMSAGAYRGYGATQGLLRRGVRRKRACRASSAWTRFELREKNMVTRGRRSCRPTTGEEQHELRARRLSGARAAR